MKFFEKIMIDDYLDEAPIAAKGWTKKSVEKFGKTIGKEPDEHGFFDACVSRMGKHMGDKAKGFCANVKSTALNTEYWRGKGKTKKEVKKLAKKHPLKDKTKNA